MTQNEERLQLTCLLTLSGIAIAAALYWLRPIMVPFVLALFIHLSMTSIIDLLKRYLKFPPKIAFAVTVFFVIILITMFVFLVSGSVGQIIDNADTYKSNIMKLVEKSSSGISYENIDPRIKTITASTIQNAGNQIGQLIGSTMNALANILSKGLLVLIFLIFLFLGSMKNTASDIDTWQKPKIKIQRYIGSKLMVSLVQGFLVGFILTVLGIDLAVMFGLFAFILNFIPSIGPIIAALLPLPVVLVSPGISLTTGLLALGIPSIIMFVIGNLIEPKIIGDSLNLHPIAILMALIFWGMLWGVVGMFLAVPLTAILVYILEEIETTRPAADFFTLEKKTK